MYTGICKIDEFRRSILELAGQLMRCPEFEVPEIYRRLLTILEHAFGEEQNLMEESSFPAIQCHLEQHARVMATLHRLHPAIMLGDCSSARRIGGKLLSDWLTLHASTQDAVMGVWVLSTQRPVLAAQMKKTSWARAASVLRTVWQPMAAGTVPIQTNQTQTLRFWPTLNKMFSLCRSA